MKKFAFRSAVVLLVFAGIAVVLFWSASYPKRRAGEKAILRIEQFRKERGRLPDSLGEIGIHEGEEGPVYYQKQSQTSYIVWYGTTLGESVTYDSDIKHWE